MTYQVVLTSRAEQDLRDATRWWATERSAEQASRWLAGFERQLQSLAISPARCPLAAEMQYVSYELRELHYGLGARPTHRAVFTIVDEFVLVLTIRHAAQDRLTPDDIV